MDQQRIRDLVIRSNPGVAPDRIDEGDMAIIMRFAEALVRECADIAFDQWVDNGSEESARPTILRSFDLT